MQTNEMTFILIALGVVVLALVISKVFKQTANKQMPGAKSGSPYYNDGHISVRLDHETGWHSDIGGDAGGGDGGGGD